MINEPIPHLPDEARIASFFQAIDEGLPPEEQGTPEEVQIGLSVVLGWLLLHICRKLDVIAVRLGTPGDVEPSKITKRDSPVKVELKSWRYTQHKTQGKPAYVFFNNQELESIVKVMPRTVDQLEECMRPKNAAKYGDAILEIVSRYV